MKLMHLRNLCLIIVFSIAHEAHAEAKNAINPQTQASTQDSSKEFRAYFGVWFVNGSFITEPKSKTLPNNGQLLILPYPGFGGVGGGGGPESRYCLEST